MKNSYWPSLGHVFSCLNESLWPGACGSMTGYPAWVICLPCDRWEWVCYQKAGGGRNGNTDTDPGGISEANGHPNLCPLQWWPPTFPPSQYASLEKGHLMGCFIFLSPSSEGFWWSIQMEEWICPLLQTILFMDVPQLPCLQNEGDWACLTFLTVLCEDPQS